MKKHNVRTTPTEQQRKLVAKARRARRKARLAALLRTTLRGLLIENGKLRQQLKTQELELNSLRTQASPVEEAV